MSELLFPAAALGITFLVLVPVLTVISRAALSHKRSHLNQLVAFGTETTFAWLITPVLLPVTWLASSTFHQMEGSAEALCLIPHTENSGCLDTMLLFAFLCVAMILSTLVRLQKERPSFSFQPLQQNHPLIRRLSLIVAAESQLNPKAIVVLRQAPVPIFTTGWFRPKIFLDACYLSNVDDEVLRAALFHEQAHAHRFDTFQRFVVCLCLSMNPLGFLLTKDFKQWCQAREAQCDGEAVQMGGDPLALAAGIVQAAKFQCSGPRACGLTNLGGVAGLTGITGLTGHDLVPLKLRIALLLNGPYKPVRTYGFVFLAVAFLFCLLAPHGVSTGAFELLHIEVERFFHFSG